MGRRNASEGMRLGRTSDEPRVPASPEIPVRREPNRPGATNPRPPRPLEFALLITFVIISTASIGYSVQMNSAEPWPFTLFLVLQLGLAAIVSGLVAFATHPTVRRILLPLAVLLSILTALPLAIGAPSRFFGYDSHLNFASTISISDSGWNPGFFSSYSPLQGVAPWPALDFLASAVHSVSDVSFLGIAQFFPLLLSTVGLLALYAVIRMLFGIEAALYSLIAIGTSFLWVSVNDIYVRQAMGNALFWPLVYVVFRVSRSRSVRFLSCAFVLAITIVFAHSLTSLMMILLLGFFIGSESVHQLDIRITRISASGGGGERFSNQTKARKSLSATLVVFSLIVVAYWTYVFNGPLQVFAQFLQELSAGYQISRPVYLPRALSFRVYLSLMGTFGFVLVMSADVLVRTIRRRVSSLEKRDYSLIGSFILLVGEASTLFHALYLDTFRFVGFSWPFLVPSVVQQRPGGLVNSKRASIVVLIAFVAFNLAIIPPSNIDHNQQPNYNAGEYRLYFYPSEYAAIAFLPSFGSLVGDQAVWHLVSSYKPSASVDVNLTLFDGRLSSLRQYDFIVVRKEDFGIVFSATTHQPATALSAQVYDLLLRDPDLVFIYADSTVDIFKVIHNS